MAEIKVWIFDVDDTLYPASSGLFRQVRERIRETIAHALGVPPGQADEIQRAYAREYGTSLKGMMERHGMDPVAFLDEAHRVDYTTLSPDPGLERALARLPGRKLLFTNGTASHARNVLDRLGVDPGHFETIIDIVDNGFVPKPAGQVYDRLLARFGIDPAGALLAEDSPRNLRPALERGLYGLLVEDGAREDFPGGGVDAPDLEPFAARLERTSCLRTWLDARFPA
ncbi:pyrimidine 5'-nucleotidase [Phaeovibrio sulfidiphilus]|uniref:Pyrimidine 5'-nucleotidase n=1 Tax=Phaeovibrio sulfidiphilus TaxID=1220600 RepID=A0A8J6YLU9_9PROT|nr:pyrimidine 5'-nucleotidase [Phaeovibrio sulfidiphilus]MBE1236785.1 pyrimidine 5'-nucleotidase [Phaeovibrio sulfidiphilus]